MTDSDELSPPECLCIKCCDARRATIKSDNWQHYLAMTSFGNFRYACEICGNKRCPHHSDHSLKCTGSNEPGQPGSVL